MAEAESKLKDTDEKLAQAVAENKAKEEGIIEKFQSETEALKQQYQSDVCIPCQLNGSYETFSRPKIVTIYHRQAPSGSGMGRGMRERAQASVFCGAH